MKTTCILLLSSALLVHAAPVLADDDAQSRAYFETGAKAYEKGDYQNAIRAFDQAYTLTKRPGLIFSIAQSYKRQYTLDSNPTNLRKALEYYRRFLAEDKSGKRRGEASSAIMEIEAIMGRLPVEQQGPVAAEAPQPTQISITTQVDEAMISIDGSPPRTLEPVEVKPGKHKVIIQATGYFPEERELFASERQMTAIDVPLRPIPAKITIEGRIGSAVTVDGSPKGTLPLLAPLEVEAGERSIAVSQSGFKTFSHEYALGRGQSVKIKADLSRTRQRITSYVMFGTSIMFAGGGVLFALQAGGVNGEASLLYNQWNKEQKDVDGTNKKIGTLSKDDLDRYNGLRVQESTASVGATVAFNLAAASGALGFLLYYFDDPKLPSPKPKKDDSTAPKKDPSPGLRDMMVVPVATPGFAGVSFGARF